MRVLVTGAAGFVGQHVLRRLEVEGYEVMALDRPGNAMGQALTGEARHWLAADVEDVDLLFPPGAPTPQRIVHLAAQTSVADSWQDPRADARSNIIGTLAVARLAARFGIPVAFAHSCAVYDGMLPPHRERDLDEGWPTSPYAVSKAAACRYLILLGARHGFPVTTLILGNVYGPGQRGGALVPALTRAMLDGHPPMVAGSGLQTRDFVHVQDVARAFALAVRRPLDLALNIGTGVETTVLAMAGKIASILGCPETVQLASGDPVGPNRSALDIGAAREAMGWEPELDVDAGLEATVGWYA